ncbi:predicted protein [Naegleria gruberi]|uniref:Predicted protein n=1 Tax=Naegleria gruberi TaxID=5762 RepID=D2V4N2_NAEGR|nr:uncharacterized protein NAEGRDRAFT_63850 [Naegleria gruberi]EFC48133.1 predicted protein [Naegleria gruberi]|eukprot:XP_002680877.1 predicted protein [Naegleria gruberi strain NEG-M]
MKELGIYKKCSSLKKEQLIEKIKEYYQEELENNDHRKIVSTTTSNITTTTTTSNSAIAANIESSLRKMVTVDKPIIIIKSTTAPGSDDDDENENEDASDGSVDIEEVMEKKRKYTPTKKEKCKSEYISPTKKEKLENSSSVKREIVEIVEDSDDDILNSSIFDNLGIVTPPRAKAESRIASSSQDLSPPRASTPKITSRPIELPTSPPKSEEKRKRRFISKCPARIEQRIERALLQKYVFQIV